MDHKIIAARVAGSAALVAAVVGISACGSSSSTAKTPTATKTPASTAASSSTTPSTTTAAPSSTKSATAPKAVAVKLSEFKISPSITNVPAGRVVFDVTNTGKVKHQFTVIHTSKSAATVLSKAKPNDDIPGAKGEISAIQPGATRKLVIKHLKPGHYALVCALPGHYQAGMFADFTVS